MCRLIAICDLLVVIASAAAGVIGQKNGGQARSSRSANGTNCPPLGKVSLGVTPHAFRLPTKFIVPSAECAQVPRQNQHVVSVTTYSICGKDRLTKVGVNISWAQRYPSSSPSDGHAIGYAVLMNMGTTKRCQFLVPEGWTSILYPHDLQVAEAPSQWQSRSRPMPCLPRSNKLQADLTEVMVIALPVLRKESFQIGGQVSTWNAYGNDVDGSKSSEDLNEKFKKLHANVSCDTPFTDSSNGVPQHQPSPGPMVASAEMSTEMESDNSSEADTNNSSAWTTNDSMQEAVSSSSHVQKPPTFGLPGSSSIPAMFLSSQQPWTVSPKQDGRSRRESSNTLSLLIPILIVVVVFILLSLAVYILKRRAKLQMAPSWTAILGKLKAPNVCDKQSGTSPDLAKKQRPAENGWLASTTINSLHAAGCTPWPVRKTPDQQVSEQLTATCPPYTTTVDSSEPHQLPVSHESLQTRTSSHTDVADSTLLQKADINTGSSLPTSSSSPRPASVPEHSSATISVTPAGRQSDHQGKDEIHPCPPASPLPPPAMLSSQGMHPPAITGYTTYARRDPKHVDNVAAFASWVSQNTGITVWCDVYEPYVEAAYIERCMRDADFIFVVCSPQYLECWEDGLKAVSSEHLNWTRYEMDIIRGMVKNDKSWKQRIVPVLLVKKSSADVPIPCTIENCVPLVLQSCAVYRMGNPELYAKDQCDLYYRLCNTPQFMSPAEHV